MTTSKSSRRKEGRKYEQYLGYTFIVSDDIISILVRYLYLSFGHYTYHLQPPINSTCLLTLKATYIQQKQIRYMPNFNYPEREPLA